jgi:hypothetical protein
MAGLDGVNPTLASAFLAMQAAAAQQGHSIGITSGYRTEAQQAALRRSNGCPDVYQSPASSCRVPTAIPGRSNHNHGLAIDISGNRAAKAWVAANAARFGLGLPVAGEDWHIELLGGGQNAGFSQGAQQMGAIGFDVDFLQSPGMSPEEKQDSLLQGYMDVITGAQQDALLGTPTDDVLATPAAEAPELGTPGLAEDFTPQAVSQELRQDVTTMPGAPGAPVGAGGGGGQWQGNIPPPGYVPPGSGVDRWRDVAIAALRYTGQNPTPQLVDLMLRRMAQESGGDPTAVNNWDSNAARGDPSKGLMQNIGSAFPERARELSSRGIFDGFANMVASIRYTLGRYGSLSAGWGRKGGY